MDELLAGSYVGLEGPKEPDIWSELRMRLKYLV